MVCMTPCEEVVISGLYGCVDHPSFNDAMKMKASWSLVAGLGTWMARGSGVTVVIAYIDTHSFVHVHFCSTKQGL